jgi:hypothetical protein
LTRKWCGFALPNKDETLRAALERLRNSDFPIAHQNFTSKVAVALMNKAQAAIIFDVPDFSTA